jgi:hypothetical protein
MNDASAGRAKSHGFGALAALLVSLTMIVQAEPAQQPVRLGNPERTVAAPRVAGGPDGTVYLLWVEKGAPQPARGHASNDDLYLARWAPGATAPEPAVRVNPEPGSAKASAVVRAQLEVGDDGTVHVLYPANARSPVNGKPVVDVRYARSLDGGRSFSQPLTLNSPSPNDLSASSHSDIAAAATFPALATAAGGRVLAFWLDSRHVAHAEDPSDLYAAVTADGGRTWSADRRLFGGQVCECCQPVAVQGAGAVLLSSRHVDGAGHRDPIVSRVALDLQSVGAPARIGTRRWEIEGCPMKATALAAAGERAYVAWYSHADEPAGVWFAISEDGGRSFDAGRPLHPQAAVADAPVIAVGRAGRVAVAWHAKAGGERRIYVVQSLDMGKNFTAPVAVSAGEEPAGYPSIAAVGDQLLLAWQQGTAGYAMRLEVR